MQAADWIRRPPDSVSTVVNAQRIQYWLRCQKSITDCSALRAPTILPTIRAPWSPCPTTHSLWGVSTPLSPTASKLAWETGF